jgi:hypothetical protein
MLPTGEGDEWIPRLSGTGRDDDIVAIRFTKHPGHSNAYNHPMKAMIRNEDIAASAQYCARERFLSRKPHGRLKLVVVATLCKIPGVSAKADGCVWPERFVLANE